MIQQHIKKDAGSLIAVMIPRETDEISEALYKEVGDYLIKRFHPHLAQWLQNEKIVEKVHKCETIEHLEKLDVTLIYPSLFSDLAEELDKNEALSDTERTFMLAMTADRMIKGAQDWLTGIGHQRANAIANPPEKGSIITMDRDPYLKKPKKGKIIT